MNKGTILVVDDTHANLKLLTDILAAEGYQVRPADSGELALTSVAAMPPELILLDVLMPGMDGFEVLRQLKAREESSGIPVIFLSAVTEAVQRVEGLKMGAVDFISKPFQREELLARVQTHLELSQLRTWLESRTVDLQQANVHLQAEIEERKRAEESARESELRYRILADSGMALVWTSGVDMKCDYFNQPWLDFTGRTLDQELGDGWVEGVHPDDLAYCIKIYTGAFDRRERFSMVYRLRRYEGEYRWIQDDGTPRYNSKGVFIGYIGHCLDITARKRAEEQIKSLLAEKELLLREVHHRIKNNMTTMMSLLSLQANNQKDPSVTAVLESAGNRLQSMMVLYDRLYRSENLREMPAADYLIPLVNEIIGTFPTNIKVTTEITIDDFVLPVNLLSPLGIIINELITNTMKYAFPEEMFNEEMFNEKMFNVQGSTFNVREPAKITITLTEKQDADTPPSVVTDIPPSVIARNGVTKQSTSTKQDCHAPPGSLAMTGNDEGSLAMTESDGCSLPQDSEPRTLNVEHRTLAKQATLAEQVSIAKQATLIIADNGIGIPDAIDPESSDGFGLYLVRMLTRQIDGTMTIERDKGTRFILEFGV